MFESPSLSTPSSFSPRARAAVLGTAVSAHLALLAFTALASVWRIVPIEPMQPTEAFISVTLPPLEAPVPPRPRPRIGDSSPVAGQPATSAPVAHSSPLVQPVTANIPIPTAEQLDAAPGWGDAAASEGLPGSGDGSGTGEGSAAAEDAAPIQVTQGVIAPVVLSRVEPTYPRAAILVHRQGEVVVEAEIDHHGTVRGVRTVSTPLGFGLDEAAMTAVRNWRFEPARIGARPVAVYFRLTVRFTLR